MSARQPGARKDSVREWDGDCHLEYLGWHVYMNTGAPYQRWIFKQAHHGFGAEPGDRLHDIGGAPQKRFQLRSSDGEVKRTLSEEDVGPELFLGRVPEWTPPAPQDKSIADAIAKLAAAVDGLTVVSGATQTLSTTAAATSQKQAGEPREHRSRGVYVERGGGRWGRDVLVAVNAAGEVVRREDLSEDAGPEEEAARASHITRYLDQVDPPPAEPDFSAAVLAFLADPDAQPTEREADGRALLFQRKEYDAGYRLKRHQKRRPRPCAVCGKEYRPGGRNKKRCADCCAAGRTK